MEEEEEEDLTLGKKGFHFHLSWCSSLPAEFPTWDVAFTPVAGRHTCVLDTRACIAFAPLSLSHSQLRGKRDDSVGFGLCVLHFLHLNRHLDAVGTRALESMKRSFILLSMGKKKKFQFKILSFLGYSFCPTKSFQLFIYF